MTTYDIGIVKGYIDLSYAIYNDYYGYTGAIMTFGNGGVSNFSHKQKLNAKGSTEAQLIEVN